MKYNEVIIPGFIGSMERPPVPFEINFQLNSVINSLQLDFNKLNNSPIEVTFSFEWDYEATQNIWLPLLSALWIVKTEELSAPAGKFILDGDATGELLRNPTHVVADRMRLSIMALAGITSHFKSEVDMVDPTIPEELEQYGDGFFFNDDQLDHPDINIATKPFSERTAAITEYLKEFINPAAKARLCWEWHVRRQRWYPRVAINFDGSNFNLITFDLDYSYLILKGGDKKTVEGLIGNALKSIVSLKD